MLSQYQAAFEARYFPRLTSFANAGVNAIGIKQHLPKSGF